MLNNNYYTYLRAKLFNDNTGDYKDTNGTVYHQSSQLLTLPDASLNSSYFSLIVSKNDVISESVYQVNSDQQHLQYSNQQRQVVVSGDHIYILYTVTVINQTGFSYSGLNRLILKYRNDSLVQRDFIFDMVEVPAFDLNGTSQTLQLIIQAK